MKKILLIFLIFVMAFTFLPTTVSADVILSDEELLAYGDDPILSYGGGVFSMSGSGLDIFGEEVKSNVEEFKNPISKVLSISLVVMVILFIFGFTFLASIKFKYDNLIENQEDNSINDFIRNCEMIINKCFKILTELFYWINIFLMLNIIFFEGFISPVSRNGEFIIGGITVLVFVSSVFLKHKKKIMAALFIPIVYNILLIACYLGYLI